MTTALATPVRGGLSNPSYARARALRKAMDYAVELCEKTHELADAELIERIKQAVAEFGATEDAAPEVTTAK
jgi:hypothetical protein